MEENLANDAWVPLLSHLLSLYPSPHSLSSSLTSSSVSHSLTFSILLLILSFSFSVSLFHSHTLSFSPLSPSPQTVTLCFIRSRCWKLREIECNMPGVWEKKKNWSDRTNCSEGQSPYFLQTQNTGNVTQSSVRAWLLSLAWRLLHINCHWLLSALNLFIFSFLRRSEKEWIL